MPKDTAGLDDLLVVNALSRIDGKLEKIDDRLDEQGKILITQQGILDEHVRRTNLLEDKIAADVKAVKEQLPKEISEHLKAERISLAKTGLKVFGVVAALGSGGFGLKELISAILKFWN